MRGAEQARRSAVGAGGPRVVMAMVACLLPLVGGCNSFLDQSELTRGPKSSRLVVSILDNIDPIDEADIEFQGATDVRPEDLRADNSDYVIGANDLVSVSIFDLVARDMESVRTARVTETGLLQLPMLPEPVKASGLTEAGLQKAIAARYREVGLMQNAQVTVTVVEARQRTFNITGAVVRPGQYVIVDTDFRVLQALVQAGDTTFPAEYAFVIRRPPQQPAATQPADPGTTTPGVPSTQPGDLAPRSEATIEKPVLAAVQEGAQPNQPQGEGRFIYIDGKPVWVPAGGQPVGTDVTQPETGRPAGAQDEQPAQPAFQFGANSDLEYAPRVIRIPLQELRNGDLRYNIVVRPNDMILVPQPVQGEYYIGGHVGAPGAYSLTGRKITLKQAVIAARMLDPFAVPWRTDIVRRIGTDREVFVRVDLRKIFLGEQPDVFLKANDVVTVGSSWYPPFLTAIRGAFRITYGFGFIYDRNFAPLQKQRFERD